MTKFRKPFFRAARGLWYVQLGGKQINLGPDRDAAFERFYSLMRRPAAVRAVSDSVAAIADRFLSWCQKNRAPDTYEWYRSRLQLFVDRYPELRVDDLRPYHVQEWIDSFEHLASGSQRNYCRAVQRALRWAEEQGIIDRSPLAHFKKPRPGRRETVISPEEYADMLRLAPNPEFRDLLAFAWETGARAAECLAMERRHVDLERARIVFPRAEEKMRRTPRIIYLSAAAQEIIRRRMQRRFNRVFVNARGRPWTAAAVNCAFCAIQQRMGKEIMARRGMEISAAEIAAYIPQLQPARIVEGQRVTKTPAMLREEAKRKLTFRKASQLAPKYCLTALRHSWCHHALRRGLDALTVSVLMGHADPSMVARVYSHLSHATDYLQEAANRAVG